VIKGYKKNPNTIWAFFCPVSKSACVFKGDAYVVTDVDPFADPRPEKITCSRNGMKHELIRDESIDEKDVCGYRDVNGKRWMVISKGNRKMIYSEYCLVREAPKLKDTLVDPKSQPSKKIIQAMQGVYQGAKDDPFYTFTEKAGHLYFQEGNDKTEFPCLFIPDEGCWVLSLPSGRKNIKFRFPDNLDKDPLTIIDISTDISTPTSIIPDVDKQPPYKNIRVKRFD